MNRRKSFSLFIKDNHSDMTIYLYVYLEGLVSVVIRVWVGTCTHEYT